MRTAIFVLFAVAALLPSVAWRPPHVPAVPTHVIDDAHVARCQHRAATWNPSDSDRSLHAWAKCMNLRRQP